MPDSHNQREPSPEERFAQLVREKREALGWSQEELARRVSAATGMPFHQTGITRIEKQARTIRLNEALVLARVLAIELGPLAETFDDYRAHVDSLRAALASAQMVMADAGDAIYRIQEEMEALTARYAHAQNRLTDSRQNVQRLQYMLEEAQHRIGEESDGEH